MGEFDTEAAALAYFEKDFLPYESQVAATNVFAVDPEGTKVGTANCLVEEEARWQHCAARSLGSSHSQRSKTRDRSRLW